MTASEIIQKEMCDECNKAGTNICPECAVKKALDLLKKQEQGLIIELPVPIGSEHYFIHPDKRRGIKKVVVVGCWKSVNDDCNELNIADVEGTFSCPIPFDDAKELLMATREEAEARLKELRYEK